ncbi:ceramidase domain-containing protein [Polymorphum gilvum]|uniref:Conserved hypothetical membrane protein n=1 Tax=Polymorphum gilvum (strain LMG 25793 / CGMCC 1.9160 / SL003B-26A1) TaxID=991905 RepID=F2IZ51_POLGS|nr:ceramidase domain-containing protein [Polymorphum gilvum]ADZ71774.1 Conserved hypothetical membrane protein [Polymorphum gilvum SL003B-26A1]
MNWTEQLNHYCERLGPGFWAEPANAVTNLAFIVAAFVGFSLWRRHAPDDRMALALIVIVFLTGVGSFLFHTFANRWSMLADVIPIALFIHVYLFVALNRFLALHWAVALAATVAFFVATPPLGGLAAPFVGSSAGYVPALAAIFVVGALVLRRDAGLARGIFAAGVVFAVSLTFRTLDGPVCEAFAPGTHFLWHLLNGTVLFLLLRVLIRHRAGLHRA